MDQAQSIGELLGALRRRFAIIVLVIGAGTIAAASFALSRASVYETSTKILIESQQIPDELARSTVNLSAAERIQLIEQRLMARDSLAALIEKLGLFADLPALPMTKKVPLLRQSARIESISSSGRDPWNNDGVVVAFTITVALGDAGQAARVANELAQSAIAQNLQVRADRTRDTLDYFEQEERRIALALSAAEAELSDFKKANEGALPEDLAPSRAALIRLQEADIAIDQQLLNLDLRRSELQAALSGSAVSGGGATGLSPSEGELQRLEIEFATRGRVLGANHPELRQLQERLNAVRALVTARDAATESGDDDVGVPSPRSASIHQQIEHFSSQIDQLRIRKQMLNDQRLELEAATGRNPEVEASLHALERQLVQLRERYTDAARRHSEARTGARLEANQQSERFEVLEAALVPDFPVGPNKKKIVIFGAGASAGLAFCLALLLETMRPSMRTSAQLERQLDIRPVVSIPYVTVPGEGLRCLALWVVGIVLVAAGLWLASPFIDRHVVPLEALKSKIEEHMQLDAMLWPLGSG